MQQFYVVNSSMVSVKDGHAVQVGFIFQRKIMYHVANTYLPTLCLLVIVELTLWFEDENLEFAVSLSLTTMLVIYTMFQSILQAIPMTAYLKLIDYWLIFFLLVPFAIFIIESFWYLEHIRESKKGTQKIFNSENENVSKKKPEPNKKFVKILVPFLTILFAICYFGFAIGKYTNRL